MQKKLDKLYLNYLKTIFSDIEIEEMVENYTLSSPQFLDIEVPRGNYLNSENKIVFVGKETNGWFNVKERHENELSQINQQFEKYIQSLKSIYFNHNLGLGYRSPIFIFIDNLMKKLSLSNQKGFILTELIRQDFKCSGLPNNLISKICFENNLILRKEIEILNPSTLIFLTGPSYDKHILLTYPSAVFKNYKGYSTNQVSIIENIPNIKKAIRIYHPDYHNRLGANFKFDMIELISDFINDL